MKKLSLDLQFILSIACVVLFIIFIFNKQLLPYLEFLVGFNLLVMGYNNYKIYQRKNFTIYYTLMALLMFILGVLRILGV